MTKDKIQVVALVAEIIGGFAIVITLLLLVVEMNESTKATRGQTAQALFDQWQETNLVLANNPEIRKLWIDFQNTGYEGLNAYEKSDVNASQVRLFMVIDNAYYQYRQNVLDEEIFARYAKSAENAISRSYFPEFWESRSDRFTIPFQNWINQKL